MGKKVMWLGPYEDIKDDPEKFAKMCTQTAKKFKKIAKRVEDESIERVALWRFIGNPRGIFKMLGDYDPKMVGYNNSEYLTWFQKIVQNMWEVFEPKFSKFIPIVSLKEALDAGLYDEDCIKEQFPGGLEDVYYYPPGKFKDRQVGGWRWFSLIVDEENWNGKWDMEQKPIIKEKRKLKASEFKTPKYYKSKILKGGAFLDYSKKYKFYAKPSGDYTVIARRYEPPFSIEEKRKASMSSYEKYSTIVLEKLNTNWDLSVWNSIEFDYSSTKKQSILVMKPEVKIALGYIDPIPRKQIHRYRQYVYDVQVGLTDKCKLELPSHIKKELSPIYDGSAESNWQILEEPYGKLVDLAIDNLRELIGLELF